VAVSQADADRLLQQLTNADERVRADCVMQLGRLKVVKAVDPLAATLAGDRSPTVREAAARALGLIGSPKALTALQNAALADGDRDVRHSAQFAMDVIQVGR
jgi:HEAT repeat protein